LLGPALAAALFVALAACDRAEEPRSRGLAQELPALAGEWWTPVTDGRDGEWLFHRIDGASWSRTSQNTPDQVAQLPAPSSRAGGASIPLQASEVAFDFGAPDAESGRIVGSWRESSWHPARFITVQWLELDQKLYYCDLDPDALTPEIAAGAEDADPDSLQFGCGGTPWRPLLRAPIPESTGLTDG
jgi:hypothetical protein